MDFHSILKDKRRILGTLIVIFLLIAIPFIIYLVFQQQIFKSKALGEGSTLQAFAANGAELPDNNGDGIKETQIPNIGLKLTWNPGSAQLTPSPTHAPSPTTSAPTATTAPGQPTPTTTTGGSCTACMADIYKDGTVNQTDLDSMVACHQLTVTVNATLDSYISSNSQYSGLATICKTMDLNSSNKTEQNEIDCIINKMNQTCSQNNIPTPTTAAAQNTCVISGPDSIPFNQASQFSVQRTSFGNLVFGGEALTCTNNSGSYPSFNAGGCAWTVADRYIYTANSSTPPGNFTILNFTPSQNYQIIYPGVHTLKFFRSDTDLVRNYDELCYKQITIQP